MHKKITIMLVEDSPGYRDVIAFGLNDEPDITIESQFNTAEFAIQHFKELAESQRPSLILLDLNLPGLSGLEAISQFKAQAPETEIIILTESDKEEDILVAIAAGAVGYLLKESSLEQITEGIRTVMAGGASLDPGMARYLLNKQSQLKKRGKAECVLSPRESETLALLAKGYLQKQIADELSISPKTVDYHIGHIYKKLGVQNAPAAIDKAHRIGLFPDEE